MFVFALVVRLLYLYELRGSEFFTVLIGDARQYDAWAQRIAAGQWLTPDVFYQSPLYPYLLAVIYRVAGHALLGLRVIQAISSATACVLLANAGERLFDKRTGMAAGLILAAYAPAIFVDGLLQKSSLDLLLVTGLLYALATSAERRRWLPLVLAGIAAGLLSINRENSRVLIPIVAIWLVLQRWGRGAILFLIAAAAAVLPFALLNYRPGGEVFLSTSQAGPNFYIGNHRGASGLYESLLPGRGNAQYERDDARDLAERAEGRPLSPGEVSRYWTTRAVADIRQDFPGWLRLVGRKLLLSANAAEAPDTESLSAYAEQSVVLRGLRWMNFGVLLPLAVLGMWLERARWRELWLLHAIALTLFLTMAAFFVFARYRLPAVPALALFAAVPLGRLSISRATIATWRLGLVFAVLAGAVAWVPINVGGEETYLNVGNQLVADGRPAQAIPLLERSVKTHPTDAADAFALAVAFDRTGNKTGALQQFQRAAALDANDSRVQVSLALALKDVGNATEALEHFAQAARLAPSEAPVRLNYGVALLESGQAKAAVEQLSEVVRLAPRDVVARSALGSALAQEGHIPEALEMFRTAVELDPADARAHANLGLGLALNGQEPAAIAELQQATRLKPDFLDAWMRLAQLLARSGHRGEAVEALQKALAVAHAQGRDDQAQQIRGALTQLGAAQ